jgi:nicotinamide mononucleotide (NMN) deamidase PncC
MESMLRSLLAVLLLISAVSAAQFSLEQSLAKVKTLAGVNEETMERAGACAARAVRHEMAHMRPAARELGLVVSGLAARNGCAESAKAAGITMEDIWKAYGH